MLQDDKGALYCLARNPKPQKLTKVHCQSLPGKNNKKLLASVKLKKFLSINLEISKLWL